MEEVEFDVLEKTTEYEVKMSSDKKHKEFISKNANYSYNLDDGLMLAWGKTYEQDPERFPAPNILDLEITTICKKKCHFCYKSNNLNGKIMTFDTFKKLFNILPKSITQIAFGADYNLTSNPDLLKMMEYAKEHYVVPNITVGYLEDSMADEIARLCGAVAVSVYDPKDKAYDTVKKLTERGMTQVNIHFMISEETYSKAVETLHDISTDPRLKDLNAIVFLSLKKKGRGKEFTPLSQEKFNSLVNYAKELNINMGFDSCSSLKSYRALDETARSYIIPCEASLESSYINVDGIYFPCSFCEGESSGDLDWKEGINVLDCKDSQDFLNKVWNNEKTLYFGKSLIDTCKNNCENCRNCPMFEV